MVEMGHSRPGRTGGTSGHDHYAAESRSKFSEEILLRPQFFVIDGIKESAHGAMPAFRNTLDDSQIADLAHYARQRFAPARPAWQNLEQAISRLRTPQTASAH
jgi:mono/diheme cytochrome c family protein